MHTLKSGREYDIEGQLLLLNTLIHHSTLPLLSCVENVLADVNLVASQLIIMSNSVLGTRDIAISNHHIFHFCPFFWMPC